MRPNNPATAPVGIKGKLQRAKRLCKSVFPAPKRACSVDVTDPEARRVDARCISGVNSLGTYRLETGIHHVLVTRLRDSWSFWPRGKVFAMQETPNSKAARPEGHRSSS